MQRLLISSTLLVCATACPADPEGTTAAPDTSTSDSSSGSTGSTSESSESTGGPTTSDTSEPTSTTGSTGGSTGEATTGEATPAGDARVFYWLRGPFLGDSKGLRFVEVNDGAASQPVTVLAAPPGGSLAVTSDVVQGRWLAVRGEDSAATESLWTVDLAGPTAKQVPLPQGFVRARWPVFSHDATRLVFAAGIAFETFEVYVCTLGEDGSCAPSQLSPPSPTPGFADGPAVFSGDDSRVTYAISGEGGASKLILADPAVPGVGTTLAEFPGWTKVEEMVFAPDGETLYYAADVAAPEVREYFAVDLSADPPGPPVTISPTFTNDVRGQLAHDGSSLLWWEGDGQLGDLWSIALDGTSAAPKKPLNSSGPGHAVRDHFKHVDAGRAVFLSEHEVPGTRELYLVDPAAAMPTPLELSGPPAPGGGVKAVFFDPGAERLLYASTAGPDTGNDLFLADLGASGPAIRINDPLPPGGTVPYQTTWSHDGALLLFAGPIAEEEYDLLVVGVHDGTPTPPVQLSGSLPPGGSIGTSKEFSSDDRRVFFTANRTLQPYQRALFMVELGDDLAPVSRVQISADEDTVDHVLVLPPN